MFNNQCPMSKSLSVQEFDVRYSGSTFISSNVGRQNVDPLRPSLILMVLVAACIGTGRLAAQEVECRLDRVAPRVIAGLCSGLADSGMVDIRLTRGDGAGPAWVGTVIDSQFNVDVTTYDYASGPLDIVRTPFGWFLLTTLDLTADPARLAWNFDREAPPSAIDLEIIAHARALLANEGTWDRADDRICAPSDETYSVYCALAEGTRAVVGEYQHRQPALQFVRRVVAEKWGERIKDHRLMDFNNDPNTTYHDVIRLFDLVQGRIGQAMR